MGRLADLLTAAGFGLMALACEVLDQLDPGRVRDVDGRWVTARLDDAELAALLGGAS